MPTAPDIITFGCRLNAYESEVMKAHAQGAGLQDAVIINTCAVTAEAERQARQTIRKIRRTRPSAKIIVTGCAAQIAPEKYAALPEVDHLIGNDLKLKAETFQKLSSRIVMENIAEVREVAEHLVTGHLVPGFEGRARAFVQVQNGCDHRCTFCIIPFGRGPSRSVPVGTIVQQVQQLVRDGYKEIVLTGVDLTSYGADLPGQPRLGQMVRRLMALVPELPRLRLSSLDPAEFDDDLWHVLEHEPRVMPHVHLSLQAGDDMVLKRMKRRHSRQQALDVCARLKKIRPDVALGADIIAGFPTETDEMFLNTLNFVAEADLTWLHVFPYSARTGTPAAKMPQVPSALRKERAAQLRAAGENQVQKLMQNMVGKTMDVLVESAGTGRTPHYASLNVPAELPAGSLQQLHVTDVGVAKCSAS